MKKISVIFLGGLGNQLFQLALTKNLQKKYPKSITEIINLTENQLVKRKLYLDFMGISGRKINKINYYSLIIKRYLNQKLFRLGFRINIFNIINEAQYKELNLDKFKNKSIIFDGYWQSEKYFYENRDLVKKEFLEYRKNIKNMYIGYETVAVHIRLGDYVDFPKSKKNHFVCDFKWYLKAINYLNLKRKGLRFLIFTNDHIYLKKNFVFPKKLDYKISSDKNEAHIDLLKMSYCKHYIISNSSFSWWASYLGEDNESLVIAPKYWYPGKLTAKEQIFRSNWILL